MLMFQGKEEQLLDSKELKVHSKQDQVCVWKEGMDVVDDNTDHRGTSMEFLIMNSIDILEEVKMLTMIMTHLSRGFLKM